VAGLATRQAFAALKAGIVNLEVPAIRPPCPLEVVLSRYEAFELCEMLAAAERSLIRSGHEVAAAGLGVAFELIEDRLYGPRLPAIGAVMISAGPAEVQGEAR